MTTNADGACVYVYSTTRDLGGESVTNSYCGLPESDPVHHAESRLPFMHRHAYVAPEPPAAEAQAEAVSDLPWPRCGDCNRPYGDEHGFPDLVLPHDVWKQISPTGDENGLLCPSCICKRLYDKGIETTGRFTSGPLANARGQAEAERAADIYIDALGNTHDKLAAAKAEAQRLRAALEAVPHINYWGNADDLDRAFVTDDHATGDAELTAELMAKCQRCRDAARAALTGGQGRGA